MSKSSTKRSEVSSPVRLIKMTEVMHRTTHGKAWIYKLIAQGRFPQPVKIGSRAIAFIESEVDDFIAERIAASRSNEVV